MPTTDRPRDTATKEQKADGWENTITGLGRSRDKRTGTRIKYTAVQGSRDKYDDYYAGDDTAATIAELPAREMTREWIELSVDDTGADIRTEEPEQRLLTAKKVMQALDDVDAKSMVAQALLWSRVHGGALLFLGVNDGADDLTQPLNMDQVRSLDFLLVFDRWEVQIQSTVQDMKSPDFGKPEIYLIQSTTETGQGMGLSTPVHASRFIRFDGVRTSRYRMALNGGWADSIYTRMEETLQDYGISWHGVCHLLQDFSQAVLKMKGLADAILESEGNLVLDRMTAMDLCRSVARAIPIDADDEDFIRVATPMSGLPETLDRLMLRVASAARMPATLLFGQSPSGLNATGESDIRFFYDQIKASQEENLRPRLDRLLEVIFAAREGPTKGKQPENWSYRFNPLWQESDAERAGVRKTQAETDAIYIRDGVVDVEEVALSRFGGDSYSTDTVLDMERRLGVPNEGAGTGAAEPSAVSVGQPEAATESVAPEQTLNGAQVTAMVDVIKAVQMGQIPKMAAQQVILAAFPLDPTRVSRMFADVVEGGTAPAAVPVKAPAPVRADGLRTDRIEQRGGKWLVIAQSTGEVLGEHPTEEEARKHLAAIETAMAARQDDDGPDDLDLLDLDTFDAGNSDLEGLSEDCIKKRGKKWVSVSKKTGKVVAKFKSKARARSYTAAIAASMARRRKG